MPPKKKWGVLLINVGTPRSPEPKDVADYLREFLMDPFVIDSPYLFRWFLVNRLVPRRSVDSSELYRKIWREDGSPLLVHAKNLAAKVQQALGDEVVVRPAMRYGAPSFSQALEECRGVEKLLALPLYPQYSLAATESSIKLFESLAEKILPGVPRVVGKPFFESASYLDAVVAVSRPHLGRQDKILFSFHGLPERQVRKTDKTRKHCLQSEACSQKIVGANRDCYRAQCYATARLLAGRLGLSQHDWLVGFQSRLGRTPWIQPFTDVLYQELPKQGVKRIAVMTPSFVADCLETLEEVQIRGQKAFQEAGGEELRLVPSLNDHPVWVSAVVKMIRETTNKIASPLRGSQ